MTTAERIADDSRYQALVARRGRFAWRLTGVVLVAYFGFIALVAFDRPLLGASLAGGATSVGIPVGLGIILLSVALTAVYVQRANGAFDAALAAIRADYDA